MLPRIEMSRDECRKCLRCLELDAYANMVSVLRAQGPFTVDKKKLLQELASVLHISNERHRAEIRRAVNDDKLSAIAEQLNGPNTGTDWTIEGRRTIPLLPRLKAHNAFTTLANSLSIVTAIANEKEPRIIKKPEFKETQCIAKSSSYMNVDMRESRKRKKSDIDNVHSEFYSKIAKIKSNTVKSDNLLPVTVVNKVNKILPSSSTDLKKHNKSVTVITTTSTTTASAQNVISQKLICNNTKVHIQQSSVNTTVPTNLPKAERKQMTIRTKPAQHLPSNNGIETEVKDINVNSDKAIKLVPISNNVQKMSVSDLNSNTQCVKTNATTVVTDSVVSIPEKCVPPSTSSPTITRTTTNTSSYNSSGPGPPSNSPSKEPTKLSPAFINQKFSSFKINKLPPNQMHGTKLAKKGNFIVLQKAPLKEITLSHGGKEVFGKFIVGGKKLHLTNQQNANAITLVPHRTAQVTNCNGEQSSTNSLATTPDHTKINNITSNMFDDTSETVKSTNEFDQGPTNFDMKFQAALVDQSEEDFSSQDKSNDSTNTISSIENNSQDEISSNEKHHDEEESVLNSSKVKYENNVSCNDENENSATIVEEYLDSQTEVYNIETTTENPNNVEVEDFSTTELFESDLSNSKFNIESYTLMETEENTILDGTESTMLIIDEIDEMCDS